MPMNDVTLAKRLVNARKDLASHETRKAKAEEFLENYDRAVADLKAEADHLEGVAARRDLSEETIAELAETKRNSATAEFREPVAPEGEAVTSGV